VVHLLDQFTIYLGHDWHWFRLQKFRQRLHNTYLTANVAESKDRIWLCQLLVVLALGESVNPGRQPEIRLDLNDLSSQTFGEKTESASVPLPGREFFEQALKLLNIPYENPSIDHIEALNLIVSI
jgi:proline utilization trans-activator